ncbi:hypothetical protein [Parasedimentitalea marina]
MSGGSGNDRLEGPRTKTGYMAAAAMTL